MIKKALLFLLWLIIWALLSWPPNLRYMLAGCVTALAATFMTFDIASGGTSARKDVSWPVRCLWFIVYVGVFLWECLKANIDVAWRVVHPHRPIRPGTIKVKTSLKSDIGLTLLSNSITLTPGTTTIDIDRESGIIYVHWLCVKEDYDPSSMRLKVVDKFENILKRIFE